MFKRSLPPAGGGPPSLSASGITRPASTDNLTQIQPLTLTLTMSADAERAGREVVALVKEACSRQVDDESIEEVATVHFFFETIARRVPEFHGYMDELVQTGRDADVRRVLDEPGRRGRRRQFPSVIVFIEQVLEENPSFSATRAVEWIDENLRGKVSTHIPSVGRMKNVHARFRTLFGLWSQSLFAPSSLLTAWPWKSPEENQRLRKFLEEFAARGPGAFAGKLTATQLPGAMLLHAPENEAGTGSPNTFDELWSSFASVSPGRVVVVGAGDPELGPYSRYRTVDVGMVDERRAEGWRTLTPRELARVTTPGTSEAP